MADPPMTAATWEFQIQIDATPARTWKALVHETGAWWPSDFVTSDKTRRFVIEPRLGGRVYEDFGGEEGLVWYTVIGLEVERSLLLAGHLLPPFGGPAITSLRLTLDQGPTDRDGAITTLLTVRDDRFGALGHDSPIEGWQSVFVGGLKTYLESARST